MTVTAPGKIEEQLAKKIYEETIDIEVVMSLTQLSSWKLTYGCFKFYMHTQVLLLLQKSN